MVIWACIKKSSQCKSADLGSGTTCPYNRIHYDLKGKSDPLSALQLWDDSLWIQSLCHVIQGGRSQWRCHLVMMSYLHRQDSTLLQGCSSVHSTGCHTGRWSTPTPLPDIDKSGRRPFGTCLRHGTPTRWSCTLVWSLERRENLWWDKLINQISFFTSAVVTK